LKDGKQQLRDKVYQAMPDDGERVLMMAHTCRWWWWRKDRRRCQTTTLMGVSRCT